MGARVFISYAHADNYKVKQIYKVLKKSGYLPWLDSEDIIPGEDWMRSISKAIKKTDLFLAVLSKNSYNRRGVIQKEIRLALTQMEELLPDDLFIIPLRLDDCEIPERLSHLQVLYWDEGQNKDKLLEAIQIGLERRTRGSS